MIYSSRYEIKEKLTDTTSKESIDEENLIYVVSMLPLEGDKEEVKEGKRNKILTPNKLLARISILLAEIKSWK